MVEGQAASTDRLRRAAGETAEEVLREYGSHTDGLSAEETTVSRVKYGNNVLSAGPRFQNLRRLVHAFSNVFILVLAAIDVLWMVIDPDIIYFIILTSLIIISGVVTFVQEYRNNRAADALISMVTTEITVRRDGIETDVESREIVVGDIIVLDTGDIIPADARIIDSNHLKVDQSVLTGEADSQTKSSDPVALGEEDSVLGCNNLAFSGTAVVGGSAEAMVVAVGNDTVLGAMTDRLSAKKPPTTYDEGSKAIVNLLLKIMLYMVPAVFAIMMIRGYFNTETELTDDLIDAVKYSVSLAIGLMPEMLPTIVSANLAKGSIEMARKKVIVKDVTAIQNFGAMDVLCSDKTGTLTQNSISLHFCSDPGGRASERVRLLACINSHNLMSATNQIDWTLDETAEEEYLTEERDEYAYVADVPFDFNRRRATAVVDGPEGRIVISKGAMPEILSISTRYKDENGGISPLDDRKKNEIVDSIRDYSARGMRVLGVASRPGDPAKKDFTADDEKDLILEGLIVFTDPIKPSAKEAIGKLREGGIDVKVLSGDNEFVSKYVCDQIGIPTGKILVGPQIASMSDEELRKEVEECCVFARLNPNDKGRIVTALGDNGHTVGAIGDGINDVIAMNAADVGISVDTGTDIAKEAADMILLEKDLNILRTGAIEGRKVYVNSIKYVKMIASINFGYMISLIIGTILFNFEPMGAAMILVFNLINDIACLFICMDKVEDKFVERPRKWDPENLWNVMYRYGPMCVVTDLLSWAFFVFVVMPTVGISPDGYDFTNASEAVLSGKPLDSIDSLLPVAVLFQSMWFIEQFWMQVWAIHIVRTDSLPFFQTCSAKILIVTTIAALAVGTSLPFITPLWEAISGCTDLLSIPLWALLWMPFIGAVYFTGAHLIKRHMLKTKGYFAC